MVPILQKGGYRTVSVANPLRSLSGDARLVSDVVAIIQGPVVLVGHSYGGQVNSARRKATATSSRWSMWRRPRWMPARWRTSPASTRGQLGKALASPVKLAGGSVDLYIYRTEVGDQFAHDAPAEATALMGAGQRPITEAAPTKKAGESA